MDVQAIISLIQAVSDSNLTGLKLEEEQWKLSLSKQKEEAISGHEQDETISSLMLNEEKVKSVILKENQEEQRTVGSKREEGNHGSSNAGQKKEQSASTSPENREEGMDIASDKVVSSPLVGTFYTSSSPESEPFVKVGDRVKKGQILGIIEAMKLMNEIESEYDGIIEAILVDNESVVEYGQPLFRIH